jgi:hypothetical protein
MYYDLLFYVSNIRQQTFTIMNITDMASFSGGFIRLSPSFNENPFLGNVGITYDVSSQVKESLTAYESLSAPDYIQSPDSTNALAFRIVGIDVTSLFPAILDVTDTTISYYYTNPILSYKNNWVIYEHSEAFRSKLLEYNWYAYFEIDETSLFPDNSVALYHIDYTIEKWYEIDNSSDYTFSGTDFTISNIVSISLSNQILNSFRILTTRNISNGSSTLLLADSTSDNDIVYIDKYTVYNDGNTLLNISGAKIFYPNGIYDYESRWEKEFGGDMVKQSSIPSYTKLYQSFFDQVNQMQVMAFNTLAPGESGDVYITYYLNRNMVNEYLADMFRVPIYLRLEFDSTMSAYFCQFATSELVKIGQYQDYQ